VRNIILNCVRYAIEAGGKLSPYGCLVLELISSVSSDRLHHPRNPSPG
jgi:hypothetical protein